MIETIIKRSSGVGVVNKMGSCFKMTQTWPDLASFTLLLTLSECILISRPPVLYILSTLIVVPSRSLWLISPFIKGGLRGI